jgi:hypothetical protein
MIHAGFFLGYIYFMLVSCLVYSSKLKMEATCSSETSVDFQRVTRCYIPEDRSFHNHYCENFKSCSANSLLRGSQVHTLHFNTQQRHLLTLHWSLGQSCGSIRKILCVAWMPIVLGLVPTCNDSFLQFEVPLSKFQNYIQSGPKFRVGSERYWLLKPYSEFWPTLYNCYTN